MITKQDLAILLPLLHKHYRLRASVSATEARDEVRMLARRKAKGLLDDRQQALAAAIHVATGRDVIELHSS